MKVGILGGGISGLGVAYFLHQRGIASEVLEKESECGGLCRSITAHGYTFDQGPHIIFSRDQDILDFQKRLLKDNIVEHRRNNRILHKGRYVKYPFENDLASLPKEDAFECLYHYIENPHRQTPPTNFKEWMYHTFGQGITEQYLLPYNEKVWSTKADQMACDWVEGRVPKPPVEDVVKSALGIPTEGYTHQLNFHYPRQGGFQELVRALEGLLPPASVTRGYGVRHTSRQHGEWVVSDGQSERRFSHLVVAMPIFHFVDCLDGIPADVVEAAKGLRYNRMFMVLVGLNRTGLSDMFAVYVPDPSVSFNRFSYYEFLGPAYAPKGKSSILAEITVSLEEEAQWKMPDADVGSMTVDGLVRLGVITPRDVDQVIVHRVAAGYVVYDLGYRRRADRIAQYAEQSGFSLCGRFAEFKYYNSDQCLRSAKTVSDRLAREGMA